mmetsp:Transcript_48550/g.99128  ORF Transcript_48550/g.99128 Transcript_48550/m.99128 type:complete len:220 (+) Transcript_48550:562-1221(+)
MVFPSHTSTDVFCSFGTLRTICASRSCTFCGVSGEIVPSAIAVTNRLTGKCAESFTSGASSSWCAPLGVEGIDTSGERAAESGPMLVMILNDGGSPRGEGLGVCAGDTRSSRTTLFLAGSTTYLRVLSLSMLTARSNTIGISTSAGAIGPSFPLSIEVVTEQLLSLIDSLNTFTACVLICFLRRSATLAMEGFIAAGSYVTAICNCLESTTKGAGTWSG